MRASCLVGSAVTIAIATWLFAQIVLSTAAGLDLADLAIQGQRTLLLTQLIALGLAAPWLYAARPGPRAAIPLGLLILIPLPLHTLLALSAPVPLTAIGLGLAGLAAWALIVTAGAALWLTPRPLQGIAPHGLSLLQVAALVIAWRMGPGWIDWTGLA